MTDNERPEGDEDLSSAPEYELLGEKGNPFSGEAGSGEDAGIDRVPSGNGEGADSQAGTNPPLPDWGPTDGEHGVDGEAPDK